MSVTAPPPVDLALLRNCQLLRGLDEATLRLLQERCAQLRLSPGATLIQSGHPNARVFVLVSGRLRVLLGGMDEAPMALLSPGDHVGELSVIDQEPASATVIADVESVVLVIPDGLLWELVRDSHALAINLLQALAMRLRSGNRVLHRIRGLLREYESDASSDPLTGLYNRRWLDRNLESLLLAACQASKPVALAMFDIDGFNAYNDSHGHLAGDQALMAVARCLSSTVRPGDVLARFGGEELLAVLVDVPDAAHAVVCERLRSAIEALRPRDADGSELPGVTVSIGFAESEPHEGARELIGRADAAPYRAKASGRNCVRPAS